MTISALALAAGLQAQQQPFIAETQHAFEVSRPFGSKWQATLHSRGRTQPGGLGPYQFRVGPIVEYSVTKRFSWIGGYYFSAQRQRERDVRGSHRPFGGGEFTIAQSPKWELDTRALAERFVSNSSADFTRYRNRFRWAWKARVAPYMSVETFFDSKGPRSVRYSGGIRTSTRGKRADVDFGYFLEPRREDLGRDRHMFLTNLHFRWKTTTKRPDPDI